MEHISRVHCMTIGMYYNWFNTLMCTCSLYFMTGRPLPTASCEFSLEIEKSQEALVHISLMICQQ